MNTTIQSEIQPDNLNKMLSSLSPERRAEVEGRAEELAKNKDFREAAEQLEKSRSLEDIKFVSEFGWLTAVSVAVAVVAVGLQ